MVRSLSRKISQLYDDSLAPSGLRATQFSLLSQARKAPVGDPVTVSALAQRLNTDRTTMTRNLRALEQAGFITLVAGKDARKRCVLVTDSGLVALQQAKLQWQLAQKRVRAICGEDNIRLLEQAIPGMLQQLNQASEQE